jgi:uncharacterized membrane protein
MRYNNFIIHEDSNRFVVTAWQQQSSKPPPSSSRRPSRFIHGFDVRTVRTVIKAVQNEEMTVSDTEDHSEKKTQFSATVPEVPESTSTTRNLRQSKNNSNSTGNSKIHKKRQQQNKKKNQRSSLSDDSIVVTYYHSIETKEQLQLSVQEFVNSITTTSTSTNDNNQSGKDEDEENDDGISTGAADAPSQQRKLYSFVLFFVLFCFLCGFGGKRLS